MQGEGREGTGNAYIVELRQQLVWPARVEVVVAAHVVAHLQERQDEAQRTKTRAKATCRRGVRPRLPFLLLNLMRFFIVKVLRSTVSGGRLCLDLQLAQQR